jgi:hypothetical protein
MKFTARILGLLLCLAFAHPATAQIKINALATGSVSGTYVTICDNLTSTYACTYNQVAAWFNGNLSLILPTQTGLGGDCLVTNGTTASWSPTCGSGGGSGTVNSGTSGQLAYYATTGIALSGLNLGANLAIVSGVLGTSQLAHIVTGTSYTIASTDAGELVQVCSSSAIAISYPNTLGSSFSVDFQNAPNPATSCTGTGTATITPTSGTINGGANLTVAYNTGCTISIIAGSTDMKASACTAVASGSGGPGSFTTLASTQVANLADGLTQASNASVDGLTLVDSTAATSGNQQFSPRLRLTGQGWKTTATAASEPVDWIIENQPVQGTTDPTSALVLSAQINGSGYTAAAFSFDSKNVFHFNTTGSISNNYVSFGGTTFSPGGIGAGIYYPSANTLGFAANGNGVGTWSSALLSLATPAISSGGTTFAVASGTGACATTGSLAGGPTAGKFICTGSTGASTVTLTLMGTLNAFVCYGRDVTTPTTVTQTGALSATSVTLTMTSVTANDVISFGCPISY